MKMKTASSADGEAMPATEAPWIKARRLSKELSATLAECNGGKWSAHIMPAGNGVTLGFEALAGEDDAEHPAVRVERLSAALAEALNGYCGGRFHVRVYPEHEGGYGFYFASTGAHDREGV
jgi:hypothetical protein